MKRRNAAVVGLLVVTGLLSGCAPEPIPTFTPPAVPEIAPPAVTADRASEILASVEQVILDADATANADALAPRVTGPAQETRRAEYALQAATGGENMPQELWTDSEITVITATDSWPRSILAISNPRSGTTVRLYLGLVQDSPRDPYRLVAWGRLLPGVTSPQFASSEIGSAPVTADQAGLLMTPTDAFAHLADTFANAESAYAGEFGSETFRELVASELSGLKTESAVAGEVSATAAAGPVVFGIGTADGGALVMGTVDYVLTLRKTVDGAKLTLGGDMAALGGTDVIAAAANVSYEQMITLYIPPEGSDQQMQILGAERVISAVERVE